MHFANMKACPVPTTHWLLVSETAFWYSDVIFSCLCIAFKTLSTMHMSYVTAFWSKLFTS